jgi:hypothetical protein
MRRHAALVCSLVLAGCPEPEPEPSPSPPAARPDARRAAAPSALATAIGAIVSTCRPPPTGELSACAPHLVRALEAAEAPLGPVAALRHYCSALAASAPLTRAVIAVRMGTQSLHRALAERPDETLHACLMKELRAAKDPAIARRLARPAAFLATALRKERELLAILDAAPVEVRQVGYECLWPNGRLQVLAAIKGGAESPVRELRLAAVMGFAYDSELRNEERPEVCSLLTRLLEDPDPVVAGSAAARTAALCPDKTGALLKAAERQLRAQRTSAELVSALQLLRGTDAEVRRARTLLARIAASPASCQACPQALAKQAAQRARPSPP